MNTWQIYGQRIGAKGGSKRGAAYKREVGFINRHMPDSLSYHHVILDGTERDVAIIDSDNLNEKYIYSMPDEDIRCGALVEWMNNYWLVTERDANMTVYTRAKLLQCNYLLRFVGYDGEVHEQWCFIEDGTKYLTGEMEDRYYVVTRGDSRIAMTIARNDLTAKFNRESRFLIDDQDSDLMLAYQLTKPLKTQWTFFGDGVYKFVLQEVVQTENDNQELRVADYYRYFPKPDTIDEGKTPRIDPGNTDPDTGKAVWL